MFLVSEAALKAHTPYRMALGPAEDLCGVKFEPPTIWGIEGYHAHKKRPTPIGPP